MNAPETHIEPDLEIESSWSVSVMDQLEKSRRNAWIIACVAAAVALLLAIAIVIMLPLKTVEPYTLLVDRQTGNVEALAPLREQQIAPDEALNRPRVGEYMRAL